MACPQTFLAFDEDGLAAFQWAKELFQQWYDDLPQDEVDALDRYQHAAGVNRAIRRGKPHGDIPLLKSAIQRYKLPVGIKVYRIGRPYPTDEQGHSLEPEPQFMSTALTFRCAYNATSGMAEMEQPTIYMCYLPPGTPVAFLCHANRETRQFTSPHELEILLAPEQTFTLNDTGQTIPDFPYSQSPVRVFEMWIDPSEP